MEDYIKRNISRWYSRMEEREDLVIVTGADKCSSWGTACYSGATGTAEMALSFMPTGNRDEGSLCRYSWRTADSIWLHCGRSSEEDFLENQCIFIRGYKAKLRKRKLLPVRVSVSDVVRPDTDIPVEGSKGPGGTTWASLLPGPLHHNRGEASQNIQSDTLYDTILVDDFPAPSEVSLVSGNERLCGLVLISLFTRWMPSIHTCWTRLDPLYSGFRSQFSSK